MRVTIEDNFIEILSVINPYFSGQRKYFPSIKLVFVIIGNFKTYFMGLVSTELLHFNVKYKLNYY